MATNFAARPRPVMLLLELCTGVGTICSPQTVLSPHSEPKVTMEKLRIGKKYKTENEMIFESENQQPRGIPPGRAKLGFHFWFALVCLH